MPRIAQQGAVSIVSRVSLQRALPTIAVDAVIGPGGTVLVTPTIGLYAQVQGAAPGIGNFVNLVAPIVAKGITILSMYIMYDAVTEIRMRYGGIAIFDIIAVANFLYKFDFGYPGFQLTTVNQALDIGNPFAPAANITAGVWYAQI